MDQEKKSQEFYERLKTQLEDHTAWPSLYLYKFIFPATLENMAEIQSIFDGSDAEINTRDSKKGNFSSISVKVMMDSPEKVVEKYLEVSKIEGLISL